MILALDKEFVNVQDLSLEHGKRYRICIHADEVTIEHEKWTETLPSVSSCSDGVVVDTTPPTPGSVWIGWSNKNKYQVVRVVRATFRYMFGAPLGQATFRLGLHLGAAQTSSILYIEKLLPKYIPCNVDHVPLPIKRFATCVN